MKKCLIVVDYQKDFVDGSLGFEASVKLDENIAAKIKQYHAENADVIFTLDTHESNYMDTQEGKNLPVRHCIRGTEGWEIIPELRLYVETVFDKPTFGSRELGEYLASQKDIGRITVIGLSTDICVI